MALTRIFVKQGASYVLAENNTAFVIIEQVSAGKPGSSGIVPENLVECACANAVEGSAPANLTACRADNFAKGIALENEAESNLP